jgi:hypothetical protein
VKITIKVHRDEILEEQYLPVYLLIKKYKWRWQSIGAAITLGGGLLAPIVGTGLNLLASCTRLGYERPILFKASTVCYVITIPLLMLGAHFLDLLEQKAIELAVSEANPLEQTIEHLGLRAKAGEV